MEDSTYKIEKDDLGRIVYYGTACGDYWWKKQFDDNDNCTSYEDSTGFWIKKEFDSEGKELYFENSFGMKRDFR
jgi:hypothetical protein